MADQQIKKEPPVPPPATVRAREGVPSGDEQMKQKQAALRAKKAGRKPADNGDGK